MHIKDAYAGALGFIGGKWLLCLVMFQATIMPIFGSLGCEWPCFQYFKLLIHSLECECYNALVCFSLLMTALQKVSGHCVCLSNQLIIPISIISGCVWLCLNLKSTDDILTLPRM